MMTVVSRRNVAILAGGYFFKSALVFLAQFADVLGSSLLQLGMVFLFPGNESVKGLKLAATHEFFLGGLGDEAAALAVAHQGIDFLDQLGGQYYMGSFVHGRLDY